jgi:signal transduction histidine kinase
MAVLLVMSSRTGQEDFDQANLQIDHVEALNFQLDGALWLSLFELRMDFDQIAELQRGLRAASAEFTASFPSRGSTLADIVERKVTAMEDFKTAQAVLRNSRAIANQMIRALWEQTAASQAHAVDLFAVERAFLDFIARRDPPSATELRTTIAEIDSRDTELTTLAAWQILKPHLLKLASSIDQMGQLMQDLLFVPIQPTIEAERAEFAEQLSQVSAAAGRYRTALFALAVVLLIFSGVMAARVRQYLRTIRKANDDLESRVAGRTRELAEVNKALVAEIAERESVESQLNIARKLEAIGELAAGIAHEINTPTQYVSDNMTFLEGVWQDLRPLVDDYERLVLSGDIDIERSRKILGESDIAFLRDEVPAAFKEAGGGLEQIGKIVLAMKTFSHPGGEGLQPSDINRALESTVTIARNEWKYVAELALDLDASLPAVPCNVSALNQVVLNLVVNAAQAIAGVEGRKELGSIKVSSKLRGAFAEISVEDDGPGVPDAIRDRIFDPFFTTKEVGKGTGQGLSIAHRVIHGQHGGTLMLGSTDGKGARFVIRLPLRVADEAAGQSPHRLSA